MARLVPTLPKIPGLRLPALPAPRAAAAALLASLTTPKRRTRVFKEGALGALGLVAATLAYALFLGDPTAGTPKTVMVFADGPPKIEGEDHDGITAAIAPHEAAAAAPAGAANPLIEMTPLGPLPRIAEDGRTPARAFARPSVPAEGRPIVSLVVDGLGRKADLTAAAIAALPPDITLVFDTYSDDLDHWAAEARRTGHEYLIEVPVEPFDFPANDPGPLALIVSARPQENLTRLHITLTRMAGYAGIALTGRSRLATDEGGVTALMNEALARGLLVFDTAGSPVSKVPRVGRATGAQWGMTDRRLDARPTEDGLALQLLELERLAQQKGSAIGTTEAYPHAIDRIEAWVRSLPAKGLVLVPVSVHMLRDEPSGLTAATPPAAQDHAPPPAAHVEKKPAKPKKPAKKAPAADKGHH